jgi:pimeloyl-ACP methyl ester carboxylesterase
VLSVSGQGQDHHLWDPIISLLASRYRLILFDNIGTGESDKPSTPYSTQLFADDAITVFDTIGVEKAHIVGIPNLFP